MWNAFHYSLAGLRAAYRHEDAFRQEVWLAAIPLPAACLLPVEGVGRAAVFVTLFDVVAVWASVLT